MQLLRFDTAQSFREQALPFLLRSEAEHGLLIGLLMAAERLPVTAFAVAVVDDARCLAVGMRLDTRLVVSRVDDARALELVASAAAADEQTTTTITGAAATVAAIVERRARPVSFAMGQWIYAVESVKRPSRTVVGTRRPLFAADRDILIDAHLELNSQLGANESREAASAIIDQRIAAGDLYAWVLPSGEIVACAGVAGPTPHGIRMNYVYTPPTHRGRGYASALVADLTQYLIDGGRSFVFLHADVANPTANAIYQRLGYERIADFSMIRY